MAVAALPISTSAVSLTLSSFSRSAEAAFLKLEPDSTVRSVAAAERLLALLASRYAPQGSAKEPLRSKRCSPRDEPEHEQSVPRTVPALPARVQSRFQSAYCRFRRSYPTGPNGQPLAAAAAASGLPHDENVRARWRPGSEERAPIKAPLYSCCGRLLLIPEFEQLARQSP